MKSDPARPFVTIRPWLRAGLLRHLSPTASRILFLMVDHAGTDGYTYPSASKLAKESGHAPKTIYAALKELVEMGCIQRKEGATGRTRFNTGHRHPGPVYYWISELDSHAERRLRHLESQRTTQGDIARFTPKIFPAQEHLTGSRCSYGRPQDVPSDNPQDVPILGRQDIPGSGTYRVFGQSIRTEPLSETPPFPPQGGTAAPKEPVAADGSSNGSGKGNGTGTTKAERMRKSLRLFFEAEARMGDGSKRLEDWQKWFGKQYDPAMIADVFREVEATQGDRTGGTGEGIRVCGSG